MKTVSSDRLLGIALLVSFFGMMIAAFFMPETPEMCRSNTSADGIVRVFLYAWCALTGFIGGRLILDPS